MSYSRHDKEIIRHLCALLRISGAEVFRDEESIQPGEKWRTVLSSSIEKSDYMLVFWSANSASSEAVREEFTSAINLDKPVVPILLDNTPLATELSQFQWIDFRIFGTANPFTDTSNPYVPNWIPIGGPLGSEDENLLNSINATLSLMEDWKLIALVGALGMLGIGEN